MLGDGITSIGISTNAIDLALNNFALGTNLANGNIIVGHSEALASVAAAVATMTFGALLGLFFALLMMYVVLRYWPQLVAGVVKVSVESLTGALNTCVPPVWAHW